MKLEIEITKEGNNSKYAPLGALGVHWMRTGRLKELEKLKIDMKTVDLSPVEKVKQIMLSILTGCEYIWEVNPKMKGETALAQSWGFKRFGDQSNLSIVLDRLSLMNIEELEEGVREIWRKRSKTLEHDWRGYLWLELDLSGLPCSKNAEKSTKGYFQGKKRQQAAK